MKIIKVDGLNKCYIMLNGDKVPFWELKQYIKQKGIPAIEEVKPEVKKPVRRRRTRKKKEL
jgi:hypothetical protein